MTSTGRIHRVAFLVFALLMFCAASGWSQGYEHKVEAGWDFTTATTTLGWDRCCEPSSGFGVSNGVLIFHATEQAFIVMNTAISVPGAPLQLVEIVMSSDMTGGDSPFAAITYRSLVNERGEILLTAFTVAALDQPPPSPILFPQIADGGGYATQIIVLNASGPSETTLSFFGETGTPLALGKW